MINNNMNIIIYNIKQIYLAFKKEINFLAINFHSNKINLIKYDL